MSKMKDMKSSATSSVPWPEDTVEYRIYCDRDTQQDEDSLARLAVDCNFACRQLSGNHVWHYAAFALRPVAKGTGRVLTVFIWLVATTGDFSDRCWFICTSQMSVDCCN